MLLQLNVHPLRDPDLLTPDRIASDPPLSMRAYLDLFGNRGRGFRVDRNPRNSGRLERGVAVCEPNSDRFPCSAPKIARQSQPAKFRFPDHEMERPEPRLRVRQIERGGITGGKRGSREEIVRGEHDPASTPKGLRP